MTHISHTEPTPEIDPDSEDLDMDGWPVLRGTPAQRDAAFVRALLEAQLAALRRTP